MMTAIDDLPDLFPLDTPFSWYALTHPTEGASSSSASYDDHILRLGACTTVAGFDQMSAWLPDIGTALCWPRATWTLDGGRLCGYGLCFFAGDARPAWEDASNIGGVDLVLRRSSPFPPAQLSAIWRGLQLMMLHGRLPEATGVRVLVRKDARRAASHKFEVWCRAGADTAAMQQELLSTLGTSFAVSPRPTKS